MTEFTIPLVNKIQRPVIQLQGSYALIDTGAFIPVMNYPKMIVERAFNATCITDKAEFGGFGGDCTGSIYGMKDFVIGQLTFNTFEFFVPDKQQLKYPLVLSSTMFYGMDYRFDTINGLFIVRVPDNIPLNREFKVANLRGKLMAQVDGVLFQENNDFEDMDLYTQNIMLYSKRSVGK